MQWRPSQLIADLQKPTLHARGWRPKPQIVELLSTDPVSVLMQLSWCTVPVLRARCLRVLCWVAGCQNADSIPMLYAVSCRFSLLLMLTSLCFSPSRQRWCFTPMSLSRSMRLSCGCATMTRWDLSRTVEALICTAHSRCAKSPGASGMPEEAVTVDAHAPALLMLSLLLCVTGC